MYDLFSIAVFVINTDERAGKGEGFTVSDEERGVNDSGGRERHPCYEQCASEDAQCCSEDKLQILHDDQTILAYSMANT